MKIISDKKFNFFKPLERITLETDGTGTISVCDQDGREYFTSSAQPMVVFLAGGSLGNHIVYKKNEKGVVVETLRFKVDCETEIRNSEYYKALLEDLKFTMKCFGEEKTARFNGKVYSFFVRWLRDHTHVLKAMKYFEDDLKSAIELYRDSQREDGMIFDNIYPRDKDLSFFEQTFRQGKYCKPTEDRLFEFRRIPVEADVEYLYVEGIYNTWRATGDDLWMSEMLDSAIKAIDYVLNSPVRWSKKYGLLKRGFTIDTWDFQSYLDTEKVGFIMLIDPEKTEFGIMHGDNTGLANSCVYLAKMLERVGRKEEADKYLKLSTQILERLNSISWNGRFFTHHVPENENVDRSALGADLENQISLSNAYALNRGISREQCISIINQYLQIKNNLPHGSAGEWYTIYPPFENFNAHHSQKWEYMNGGVITIVAGELSKGAFENGYEEYGVDILKRIKALSDKHDGYLHCTYKGCIELRPHTNFTCLPLDKYANTDFYKDLKIEDAPELLKGDPEDLDKRPIGEFVFRGVRFISPDPDKNEGKSCIYLSCKKGARGLGNTTIKVGKKAKSIYMVHTMAGQSPCGKISVIYENGERQVKYINEYKEIGRWYQPERRKFYGNALASNMELVWHGKNDVCDRVGISAYCFDLECEDEIIDSIELEAMENNSEWYVFAITLSDQPASFYSTDVSFGIPDNWGAAAVTYALIEGLAGVNDDCAAFEQVTLSPRWVSANTDDVGITVKYPASGSYVCYNFKNNSNDGCITIEVTGSFSKMRIRCLMPENINVKNVVVNGRNKDFIVDKVVDSLYTVFNVEDIVSSIDIFYE